MPQSGVIVDPSRPEVTRHEYLSASSATPTPSALASAPQASLVVTTLADVVDATDGVLSLREAVDVANDTPGLDRITFAAALRGGTIDLDGSLGRLTVTDDLIIDGDPLDGGPDSLRLDAGFSTQIDLGLLRAEGAALRLEDLTIQNVFDMGVRGDDAALDLTRVAIDGVKGGADEGVSLTGGSLVMESSSVTTGGGAYSFGILFDAGASVAIVDSVIRARPADSTAGIAGRGSLVLIDSHVVAEPSLSSVGISVTGDALIDGSTITAAGTTLTTGVRVNGELVLINSTVADVIGASPIVMPLGIDIAPDSTALIVNSTITGTTSRPSSVPTDPFIPAYGLFIDQGGVAWVGNSIIDDSVGGAGSLASNGANTFRDSTVGGAIAGDRLGVSAEELFAATKTNPGASERSGVLADNGGPTPTVALLDNPANPALDVADPALAPLFDQRGFVRDATPDIGAFELGAGPLAPPPPLPPLAEKVPLADADIVTVPPWALVLGAAADAEISFVDEVAALQNSLGVYLIGPDGELAGPRWVFERVEHAEPSDDASEQARPGGGPLAPGDAVLLSDLFDPAELLPGTTFGLFLAADAWNLNPAAVFEGGTLEFRADGGPASLFDPVPALFHISESGVERLVAGDIMHTADPSFFEPLANPLNPGGGAQVTSGTLDGLFTVAFEDKPLAASDRDFNDALFAVDLLDAGDELFAVAAVATAGAGAMPAGGADLETLLTAVEAG